MHDDPTFANFITAMRRTFGDRAAEVACDQAAAANGEALTVWTRVYDTLRAYAVVGLSEQAHR